LSARFSALYENQNDRESVPPASLWASEGRVAVFLFLQKARVLSKTAGAGPTGLIDCLHRRVRPKAAVIAVVGSNLLEPEAAASHRGQGIKAPS
jgi:hypothetical protein